MQDAKVWYALVVIFTVAYAFDLVFLGQSVKVIRRLKGSRVSYFISPVAPKILQDKNFSLKDPLSRLQMTGSQTTSVIEISQGPFRQPCAIYGCGVENWRITKTRAWPKGEWVFLAGGIKVIDGSALRVINTYSSLQAMLDRIAELEMDLKGANEHRQAWRSAVYAALAVIDRDRQKYRSQSTQNIRQYLEAVTHSGIFADEPKPTPETIAGWTKLFLTS